VASLAGSLRCVAPNMEGSLTARNRPSSCGVGHNKILGNTATSMLTTAVGSDPLSARSTFYSTKEQPGMAGWMHSTWSPVRTSFRDSEPRDPNHRVRRVVEADFFANEEDKQQVISARKKYPRKKVAANRPADALSEDEEESIPRRIMGFNLGFEKIFATTSMKLPVSAYTIFVELHAKHREEAWSRCFNGLHTVLDLKKWVYEKLLVPMDAYDLSYAEPGKAELTDQLRLLSAQDSLDTRTLATTRAVQRMYKGPPGVHAVGDVGVTRLYVRLKCRTCGDLLTSLQKCRKYKKWGHIEPPPNQSFLVKDHPEADKSSGPTSAERGISIKGVQETNKDQDLATSGKSSMTWDSPGPQGRCAGIPGLDPNIEDCWYKPDEKKHCLFNTRGYEMFEAARTHGGAAELARIYIASGKEPSKMLKLAENVLKPRGKAAQISY